MKKVLIALSLLLTSSTALSTEVIFSTLGVTYHGDTVSPEVANHMPYRITDDGKYVFHPQTFGFNLITDSGFHLSSTYLKDCFDQKALLFGLGHHWHPLDRVGLGYLAGVYIRERYVFIDSKGKKSRTNDMFFFIERGDTQYIPLVMLTASAQIYKADMYSLDVLLAGNWFINHLQIGLGLSW